MKRRDKDARFSIGLDHHPPWVCAIVSALFVLTHVLFVLGQCLVLWEIRVIATLVGVGADCGELLSFHVNNTHISHDVRDFVAKTLRLIVDRVVYLVMFRQ